MAATFQLPRERCPACRERGDKAKRCCGGCRNVAYCSAECQQADWPTHKLLCRTFRSLGERPRRKGRETVRRMMVLGQERAGPELVWREVERGADGVAAPVDVRGLLGLTPQDTEEAVRAVLVTDQPLLRAALPYALCVFCVTLTDDERQPVNRAAAALVAGRTQHRWRRSMAVMVGSRAAFRPGAASLDEVGDVDLNHLPDVVAFLLDKQGDDGDARHRARTRCGREYRKVAACRLACQGRERASGGNMIEGVEIPPAHYLFESEDNISPLSRLAGMPLHMVKYASSKPHTGPELDNVAAKHLQNTIDSGGFRVGGPGSPRFGAPPAEWLRAPGDVLVARQDREPLAPETLGIFSYFCRFHFDAWYQWGFVLANCQPAAQAVLDEADIKRVVLHHFSPDMWKDYFRAWTTVARAKEELEKAPSAKTEARFDATVEEFAAYALDACSRDRLLDDLNARTWEPVANEDV